MGTLCYPSINDKFSARLSVGFNFSGLAEGNERIGFDHYGLDDDAVALRLRHSALREQLPLIEARRKPVAVLHNFPDTLIVLASKPRRKVCHRDAPLIGFSLACSTRRSCCLSGVIYSVVPCVLVVPSATTVTR